MIYTLTLNPALDYHVSINSLQKNMLNLPDESLISIGGKGINVSKVLNNLYKPSSALGFIGGFTGTKIIDDLNKLNISTNFININNANRINLKIKQTDDDSEIEIAGISPIISEEEVSKLLSLIKSELKQGDFLVCSGSIPSCLDQKLYKNISSQLNGVKIVLDTRGDCILDNLHNNFLIKPNIHELEGMLNTKIMDDKDIIQAAPSLLDKGVENIIVSLGKNGSLYLNKNEVYRGLPMKINFINTVGAGDSMVAGFVYAASQGMSAFESYKFSIAAACATISSYSFASKQGIEDYLPKIIIEKI